LIRSLKTSVNLWSNALAFVGDLVIDGNITS
jgi:hypothetical protein